MEETAIEKILSVVKLKDMWHKFFELNLEFRIYVICITTIIGFFFVWISFFYNIAFLIGLIAMYWIIYSIICIFPKENLILKITQCEIAESNSDSIKYRIICRNPTNRIIVLDSISVNYRYIHGTLCALETPKEIETIADIPIRLVVNTSDSERKSCNEKLKRKIEFLPNSANTEIYLELYIVLEGGCSWHPCCNWNLLYDVTLIDVDNKKLKLIKKTKWRQDIEDEE